MYLMAIQSFRPLSMYTGHGLSFFLKVDWVSNATIGLIIGQTCRVWHSSCIRLGGRGKSPDVLIR